MKTKGQLELEYDWEDSEYEVVWVKWFRHSKTGKIIYASTHGKEAFPLKVKKKAA